MILSFFWFWGEIWPAHVLNGFHESLIHVNAVLFLFHPDVDLWGKQRVWWGGAERVWSSPVHSLYTGSSERLGQRYCPAAGVFGLWHSTNPLRESEINTLWLKNCFFTYITSKKHTALFQTNHLHHSMWLIFSAGLVVLEWFCALVSRETAYDAVYVGSSLWLWTEPT